jgi:hypothetical protein
MKRWQMNANEKDIGWISADLNDKNHENKEEARAIFEAGVLFEKRLTDIDFEAFWCNIEPNIEKDKAENLPISDVSKNLSVGQKYQSYLELCSYYIIDVIPFYENWLDQFAVLQKRFDQEFKKVFKESLR